MLKLFILGVISSVIFGANVIMPMKVYAASGGVTDLVYHKSKLYIATSVGCVDIFDITKNKKIRTIKIQQIKDFMGDNIDAKIFSVDIIENQILLLSQADHGYRKVEIFTPKSSKVVIDIDKKLHIAKAKFLDKNTLILGLLSNDIISYNIAKGTQNWMVQASQSKFSNFALSEDKTKVVVSDESGVLHLLKTSDGSHIKELTGENLDNVFQVDYKNNTIISGGQDRRVVVYNLTSNHAFYNKAPFIVYSVGLSPEAKYAAYASDENNNVVVFKVSTNSKVGTFGGNAMTLTNIVFMNEKEFFVSSDDKNVNYYKLK